MSTFLSAKMKILGQSVVDFYKLHHEKSKLFISNLPTLLTKLKKTLFNIMKWMTVSNVEMLKILHNEINKVHENGLVSLLK